jgi:hypothetical protein
MLLSTLLTRVQHLQFIGALIMMFVTYCFLTYICSASMNSKYPLMRRHDQCTRRDHNNHVHAAWATQMLALVSAYLAFNDETAIVVDAMPVSESVVRHCFQIDVFGLRGKLSNWDISNSLTQLQNADIAQFLTNLRDFLCDL